MISTTNLANHPSVLSYESTQTRTLSKRDVFLRAARNCAREFFKYFMCHHVTLEETAVVTSSVLAMVECDVEDLVDEIKIVNEQLALLRGEASTSFDVEQSALEVAITLRESMSMLSEDRDVVVVLVPFELVEPEIIGHMRENMQQSLELTAQLRWLANADNPREMEAAEEMCAEVEATSEARFIEEHGVSFAEVALIAGAYALAVNDTYYRVVEPDGSTTMARRPTVVVTPTYGRVGAQFVVPGWSLVQHDAAVKLRTELLIPRKIFPRLVAACTLDARSRWGLRPDTQANRLMVGDHMRKQLRVGELRKSTVDANVALSVNLFFIPHAGDLLARAQAIHWSASLRWRDYDLLGSTWWQRALYTGTRVATPVV